MALKQTEPMYMMCLKHESFTVPVRSDTPLTVAGVCLPGVVVVELPEGLEVVVLEEESAVTPVGWVPVPVTIIGFVAVLELDTPVLVPVLGFVSVEFVAPLGLVVGLDTPAIVLVPGCGSVGSVTPLGFVAELDIPVLLSLPGFGVALVCVVAVPRSDSEALEREVTESAPEEPRIGEDEVKVDLVEVEVNISVFSKSGFVTSSVLIPVISLTAEAVTEVSIETELSVAEASKVMVSGISPIDVSASVVSYVFVVVFENTVASVADTSTVGETLPSTPAVLLLLIFIVLLLLPPPETLTIVLTLPVLSVT